MANKYFHESNRKTKYGEHDVKFWIGTVVAFASQEKQIEDGFGWMYKVRVDGDHAVGADSIKDEQLSYAYCILPTTAGSGGAFKLRSVRISQGDTVFGVRGGGKNAPHFIIGVFPRTRLTKNSSGNFGMLSGFYGALKKNKTLSGEFNDQVGPATPGVTPISPKNFNKANAKEPSKQVEQLGYDPKKEGEIVDVEEKIKPKVTDPNKVYTGGEKEPITKGQLEQILSTESDEEKNQILSKTIPEVGEKIILEDGTEGVVKDVRLIGEQSSISGTSLGSSASEIIPSYTPLASREKVSVVNGVEVTTTEITLDPNGEKFGGEFSSRSDTKTNTAHKKPGGVEAYWANLEKERELTENEQRWRRKGWDQFGASKKSYTKTFSLVGGGPILQIGGVASYEDNAQDKWKSYTVKSILKAQTQGLVEDNVAVEATSLVEQGRYVDALDLVFPSGYNPTLEI